MSTTPSASSLSRPASSPHAAPAATSRSESRLRLSLRLNAGFSTSTGAVALIAGGWVADQLGLDQSWAPMAVRLLGVGLLGFAALLLFESGRQGDRLASSVLQVSMADLGWVVGSGVLMALGLFSSIGNVVVAVIALVVLDLALFQLWSHRHHRLAAL